MLACIGVTVASIFFSYRVHQQGRESRIKAAVELLSKFEYFDNNNPSDTIDIANRLIGLGKTDALEALTRFDKQEWSKGLEIEVIIPLIFSRKNQAEKLPSRDFDAVEDYVLDRDTWNTSFEIADGIPFETQIWVMESSMVLYSGEHVIAWASERGVLRRSKLIPTDNPFETAEKLISRLIKDVLAEHKETDDEFRESVVRHATDRIQGQVFQMVEHLVPNIQSPNSVSWSRRPELWKKLKDECLENGLKWSISRNCYEFKNN